MSNQILVQIQKEIFDHLRKELELYEKEDSYKLAKSQERKTFRKLLKEKNLAKEYNELKKRIATIRKENNLVENDNARSQFYRLLTQKLRIEAQIKSEKEFIEANQIAKEKAKMFREAYRQLREDFFNNVKPKIPL